MSKLLWAGPWNINSAIALFGASIVRELQLLGYEVEIYRTETGAALEHPPLQHSGPIHTSGGDDASHLARTYDHVVVNLGDHYAFHSGALPILENYAPVGILHDAWMDNFVRHWKEYSHFAQGRIDRLHDDLDSSAWVSLLACSMSAAIVHGPHYKDPVQRACPGPTALIPLAYSFPEIAAPRLDPNNLTIATIGHINPNKRAEDVIRALAMSPHLRDTARYMLVGAVVIDERNRLTYLARDLGVPPPIFTGWVEEDELRRIMAQVDVVCCLRDPCLEGGSASLVTALLSRRPTLVTDHGHYSAVPEDIVLHCSTTSAVVDIMMHLEGVANDPVAARAMGNKAREYALAVHAPKTYTQRLVEVLDQSVPLQPLLLSARRLGRELSALGAGPGDPVVTRSAEALGELTGRALEADPDQTASPPARTRNKRAR